MEIIARKYEHYNRALGRYISSKAKYEKEMYKQGMVSFEKGQRLADDWKKKSYKPYDRPSDKTMSLIREISDKKPDKNGKIKLSDGQIDAMKETGVNFNPRFKPDNTKGGFDAL